MPVFVGDVLLALVGVMAHWQDIGGMVPGSLAGTATEIFQEGVRIPALRVARRGEYSEELLDLLFANVREPEDRRGDLRAMEGACLLAQAKLQQLATRWGVGTVAEAMTALLDRAEKRMRAAIAAMPDGSYRCEVHLDNTGSRPEPLALKLCITVAGDGLIADFTGCPPQMPAPTNLGPAHTRTAVFTMTKAFLDPKGPINAGAMRPLKVVVPAGTMLNARSPAACGAIGEVRRALEGLVMGALGRAVAEKAVGDLKGASNITTIGWPGRPPFVEFPAGGTGARAKADGNNAVRNFAEGDLSSIQPAEAVELRWPLLVERCALRADSGGPGRFRGGLGLVREVRVLAPDASLSVLSDRNLIPPYGVNGGFGGARNQFTVRRNGVEIEPSPLPGKVTAFPLETNDVVVIRSAGGGGYGDPLQRELALVQRDVAFGYVSREQARKVYGVDGDGRRQGMNDPLPQVPIICVDTIIGRRRIVIRPTTARRLGVAEGDLVDLPTRGPSLRAWVTLSDDVPDNVLGLDQEGIALLAAFPGATTTLRRIEAPR